MIGKINFNCIIAETRNRGITDSIFKKYINCIKYYKKINNNNNNNNNNKLTMKLIIIKVNMHPIYIYINLIVYIYFNI